MADRNTEGALAVAVRAPLQRPFEPPLCGTEGVRDVTAMGGPSWDRYIHWEVEWEILIGCLEVLEVFNGSF